MAPPKNRVKDIIAIVNDRKNPFTFEELRHLRSELENKVTDELNGRARDQLYNKYEGVRAEMEGNTQKVTARLDRLVGKMDEILQATRGQLGGQGAGQGGQQGGNRDGQGGGHVHGQRGGFESQW